MKIKKTWIFAALLVMILASAVPCGAGIKTDASAVRLYGASSKKNGLKKEDGGYRYYKNGKLLKNAWKTVSGKKYYFKSNGYAATGSYKVGDKYYIFNAKGQLYKPAETKVVTVSGVKYQVSAKGLAVSGWDSSKTCYFAKSGKAYTGIRTINKEYYCFKDNGKYDEATTTELREAAADTTANRAAIIKIIIKSAVYEQDMTPVYALIGKPKSSSYSNSCMGSGKDGILTYDDITVSTYRSKSGKEVFMAAWEEEE